MREVEICWKVCAVVVVERVESVEGFMVREGLAGDLEREGKGEEGEEDEGQWGWEVHLVEWVGFQRARWVRLREEDGKDTI